MPDLFSIVEGGSDNKPRKKNYIENRIRVASSLGTIGIKTSLLDLRASFLIRKNALVFSKLAGEQLPDKTLLGNLFPYKFEPGPIYRIGFCLQF